VTRARRTPRPAMIDRFQVKGAGSSALVVIDVQTRMVQALKPKVVRRHVANMKLLLEAARALGIPILVTEHYPQGLGPTIASLRPLLEGARTLEKIIFSAENGIPLINFPAPQAGGTAPMSFAGTVVQGSAESLSGLVLAQTVRPGAPFIYGAFATILDMRSTIFSYGAFELSLMCGALAQMAQYYRLPFFGTAGATDAKFNDAQAGVEATFQVLSSAAIGSGLVHDCSAWMDHGSMVSPGFMVLVNEILHLVKGYMKGLTVSQESLAVELIDQAGPGGNYLQSRHTMNHFRKVFYSDLFERMIQDRWLADGAKTFEDRLREKTLKAMEHVPEPLAPEVVRELDRMQAAWQ